MFHVKQKRVAFRCSAGACLLCRRLPLPLVCLSAPIPPTPFPAGRGRPRLFYARGFAPCIPGVEPGRRWLFSAASVLFRPHPPCPLPGGKGGIFGFLMQGAPPLASPALSRPRHLQPLPLQCPAGGCVRLVACCPCLWFAFLLPSPRPALAERSSRREGGDFFVLFCRGLAPPAPLLLNPRGTGSVGGLAPPAPLAT